MSSYLLTSKDPRDRWSKWSTWALILLAQTLAVVPGFSWIFDATDDMGESPLWRIGMAVVVPGTFAAMSVLGLLLAEVEIQIWLLWGMVGLMALTMYGSGVASFEQHSFALARWTMPLVFLAPALALNWLIPHILAAFRRAEANLAAGADDPANPADKP